MRNNERSAFSSALTNNMLQHKKGAKTVKRRKDVINGDNLANNITPRRDGEELAFVVQRNRTTNKSH